MSKLLLVSDGLLHPPITACRALQRTLEKMPAISILRARSLEALLRIPLNDVKALVIYFQHRKISSAALEALDRFVREGGGLLAVHSATASFKDTAHYFEILGGRFTSHGPVGKFEITPYGDGDIFTGLPAFTVRDELYLHELQPGIQIHFQSILDGQPVPVVWTYPYGQGRVCYACPGHRTASMAHPVYQQVLQRGLGWVLG